MISTSESAFLEKMMYDARTLATGPDLNPAIVTIAIRQEGIKSE